MTDSDSYIEGSYGPTGTDLKVMSPATCVVPDLESPGLRRLRAHVAPDVACAGPRGPVRSGQARPGVRDRDIES
jgi:hypothetical protein